MRILFRVPILVALLSTELYVVYAVLHPHVSPEYRAFFIDGTEDEYKPSHYLASPEQGIDFSRAGWPDFVRNSSGFTLPEAGSRWTVTDRTSSPTLFLNRRFSGPLCIEMMMQPSPAERGQNVRIMLGTNVGEVQLNEPGPAAYRVSFEDARAADTLQFQFAGPVPRNDQFVPRSPDPRRLGVRISTLRIFPSTSSEMQSSATR